jgi:release factor glutamine methyltransferase
VTSAETLAAGRRRLAEAGIEDAALEAELLLRQALGLTRERLLARLRDDVPPEGAAAYESLLARRIGHEPSAYITGRREFYGRDFEVTPEVLIPRPETELLVETAVELATPRSRIRRGAILADVGTGSAVLAVTLALCLPRAEVYAIDVSREALEVASRNVCRHGVDQRVHLLRGDLLTPLPEYVDVIVANLPYVKSGDWSALPPEVRDHEPRLALDGGPDGLDVVRRLLAQSPHYLRPRGALCLEIGADQGQATARLAADSFPTAAIEVRRDLAARERVLVVSLQS